MFGGDRAYEELMVDNLKSAIQVGGSVVEVILVAVETMLVVLESLPLLEAATLLVSVEMLQEAKERVLVSEEVERALKVLVFQGMKK